ncbi:MAG: TRAP transporter small permease [Limnochordia bacterium]
MWNKFNRALDILGTAMYWALCLVVFLQVVCRFLLKVPSPWTEEIARYLLVQITFLGSAIALREETHLVAVDPWKRMPAAAIPAGIITRGAVLYFTWAMFRGGLNMMTIAGPETATSLLWLRMSYIYAGMAASFFLASLYTLINILRTLVGIAPHSPRAEEGQL